LYDDSVAEEPSNPFRFGALALDDEFADRESELRELKADASAGQDVVLFAPRRYGKSSLVWRLAQELVKQRVLVAQVDLMTTPTPAKLAEKLAKAIHDDLASPLFRARERLRVFQGLRVTPTITVDPNDGSMSFGFGSASSEVDIMATIERLLELPGQLAGERDRRVVLVLDEFQEVVEIDPALPRLLRAAFQQQPEVCHLYLGSRRHMMQRIFNDVNEPFWRSAKRMELGVIDPALFAPFISARFAASGRAADAYAVEAILATTFGHPYATQELCYFVWQRTPAGAAATAADVEAALGDVIRSENAHFTLVWERATSNQRLLLQALAREPGHPLAAAYRRRHGLPSASAVQRALTSLEHAELVGRGGGRAWIAEPFLPAWLRRAA
jgi:hypothetical protein